MSYVSIPVEFRWVQWFFSRRGVGVARVGRCCWDVMLELAGRMGLRRAIRRRVPEAIHDDSEIPNVLKSRDACGSSDSYENPILKIFGNMIVVYITVSRECRSPFWSV